MSLTGYIGKGMLSCAVAGSIFTSPPPQAILTGIRTIAKDNPGNVLLKCIGSFYFSIDFTKLMFAFCILI